MLYLHLTCAVQDVRACIEESFLRQYKRKSPDFHCDVADNSQLLRLEQLMTYDAVLSW
jgi:hypothetical protein